MSSPSNCCLKNSPISPLICEKSSKWASRGENLKLAPHWDQNWNRGLNSEFPFQVNKTLTYSHDTHSLYHTLSLLSSLFLSLAFFVSVSLLYSLHVFHIFVHTIRLGFKLYIQVWVSFFCGFQINSKYVFHHFWFTLTWWYPVECV